jgi:hypothetical protein
MVLRYFDMRMVSRIFGGAAISAITWVLVIYFAAAIPRVGGAGPDPRSVGFIYCGFMFVLLSWAAMPWRC